MRDHLRPLADRRQVVGPIPLGEQVEIARQLVARRRTGVAGIARSPPPATQARMVAATSRPSCRSHGRVGCRRGDRRRMPRFRCTSSSEIAAGVMPEMRAAWPIVSGRCAVELLLHLDRQARAPSR